MNDAYSPHTSEHIATDTPADWMGRAGKPAPEYNPQTHGCFWRGDAWDVVEAAPAPVIYPKFYGNEKLDLFTPSEQLAVVEAAISDPVVKLMYDRLLGAAYLTYEDPETEVGLEMLVSKGLITAARKAEIVATMQPQLPESNE